MAAVTALALTSLALTAGSAYMSYRGQKEMAKTATNVSDYNALIKEEEAIQLDMEARENMRRGRKTNKAILSADRAKIGASGVTMDGSPLEVMAHNAATLEMNLLNRDRQFRIAGRNARSDAQSIRMGGQAQATGFNRQATGTLLAGAGQTLGSGFNLYRSGAIG